MSSFKLRDVGVPTMKKIMQGKNWVGRVVRHADGGFLGVIQSKKLFVRAPTEVAAFEEVVAQSLGYATAADLKAHNARVRADNRVRTAVARDRAHRFMTATSFDERMAVVDEVLGIDEAKP